MKKSIKKHDLFKIIGIAILFTALLTWIIPVSQYTGTEMYVGEISRLGIANLFASGVYSLSTMLYQVTFLLVLGGFYGLLSVTSGYKSLVEKIVAKLKGKEIPFILITSFILAGLGSIISDLYVLLIFVPFLITIVLNLKMDKITAICTTFGSILIGRIGATFSPYAYNYINSYFTMDFTSEIITKVAIFVLAYVLFNFFNLLHTKEVLKSKKKEVCEDKFELMIEEKSTSKSKKNDKKVKSWPLVVVLLFVFVLVILGFVAWSTSFNITIFEDFHNWLLGLKIGDHAIFSYILGTEEIGIVKALGLWDLFNIQIILIIASLIIALMYKVKFDDLIESFITGAKKMSRLVIILVMVYAVFIITVWNPFVPTIVDWIMGLMKNFNIYLGSLASFIASVFSVDLDFAAYSLGSYFASLADNQSALMGIIMNAMHGFAGFFVPTSAILMMGLAYLNISYKEWMKYIWKFLVGMLVGLLIIFTIVRYL